MALTNSNTRTRIAIDTVFFNMPYSGISRVWEAILTHLDIQSLEVELILLIRGKEIPPNISRNGFHKRFPLSQIIHINEFAYPIMQQDVDYLNQLALQHHWNYFISTYFTYCTVIPNILLIHDMIPEKFKLVRNHMWMQKDLAIRNASRFICISNTTKNDLIGIYPYLATENYPITVIQNSVPISAINITDSQDASLNILISRGIQPKQYILTMATNNEAYKNQGLIKSMIDKYQSQLAQKLGSTVPLVVITKNIPSPNGILSNGTLLMSDVPDTVLQMLYKNAAVFINPSLAEGFGLPVFEAFMYKVPVIACNLPVYEELCSGAITYMENDVDDLFQKILYVLKGNATIQKRIENGTNCVSRYTLEKQVLSYEKLFNSLILTPTESLNKNTTNKADNGHNSHNGHNGTESEQENSIKFLNIIFQSYSESNPARKVELEHCILANLENPNIKYIHDFAINSKEYLPVDITSHPKYILVPSTESNNGAWLNYKTAFTYSSKYENTKRFGIYWGIINCDIMLEPINKSKDIIRWQLIRGWLNSGYILAQSRHEYEPISGIAKLDTNFAKFMHSNTQDAWFYSTEKPLDIKDCNFEIGMLGCDNAIAHRLLFCGYKVINMPIKFPIWHYDIVRGKNSTNFLEKHKQIQNNGNSNGKPQNTHPERIGQALIPNYDALMVSGGGTSIDIIALINQLGGISNWEKYKLIGEMMSSRILIFNP